MNNNEVIECAIELKYAPRKCEYFCMGDCCLPDTNRSCGTDKDNCEYYNFYAQLIQLKAENDKLTQKLEKAREALKQIIVNDQRRYERDLTPTSLARLALKELE